MAAKKERHFTENLDTEMTKIIFIYHFFNPELTVFSIKDYIFRQNNANIFIAADMKSNLQKLSLSIFFKSSFEDFYEAEVSVRLQAVIIIYVCQYGQLIIGFFLF